MPDARGANVAAVLLVNLASSRSSAGPPLPPPLPASAAGGVCCCCCGSARGGGAAVERPLRRSGAGAARTLWRSSVDLLLARLLPLMHRLVCIISPSSSTC